MKRTKIRVLIADNHLLIREGIRSLLLERKDIRIIGEALDSMELARHVRSLKPNVVIIDFHLPGFFSIEDIRTIYMTSPETNVMVVTTNQNKKDIIEVLEYGVSNYILKLCDKEEFIRAVYSTARKEKFFCGKVVDAIVEKHFPKKEHCGPTTLTPREIQIITLISEGMTNNEIAKKLFISVHTANTHRKNMLKKLKLKNTSELIMHSVKAGIIHTAHE